jgi:hypothetical protein
MSSIAVPDPRALTFLHEPSRMNHRQILDLALRSLPARKAAYLSRVADALDRRGDLEDRRHLLYPVLAAAAPGIEPMLDPQEVAELAVAFLREETDGIAATLYSAVYLTGPRVALAPWGQRLQARLAALIFDRMAAGTLRPPEQHVWHFRSDTADPAFPFHDDGDEDA